MTDVAFGAIVILAFIFEPGGTRSKAGAVQRLRPHRASRLQVRFDRAGKDSKKRRWDGKQFKNRCWAQSSPNRRFSMPTVRIREESMHWMSF